MTRRLPVLALLALVSCTPAADEPPIPSSSTSTTSPPTTSPTPQPATPEEALDAFGGCMAERDVDVGPLQLDEAGRLDSADLAARLDLDRPEVSRALDACAGLLVAGGALDLSQDPFLARRVRASLEAYAACMRAEGIEGFPDPSPGFTGTGAAFPPDAIPYDADGFDAAASRCWGKDDTG